MPIWTDAVTAAIRRYVTRTGSPIFSRQAFIDAERTTIEAETGTRGVTPTQTLGRILQELRDDGLLEFRKRGNYRWLGDVPEENRTAASKGVFVTALGSPASRQPDLSFRFPRQWLRTASRMEGSWILYQASPHAERRGYYAVAKVERLETDPADRTMYFARINRGSYLEFGRDVPLRLGGRAVEHGLEEDGQFDEMRASQPIRSISEDDFHRIVDLALINEDELLPRTDDEAAGLEMVAEDHAIWDGPVDRTTRLVSRTVRDQQFRRRVLDVYGARCALTGMKLVNGGGRAEVEAAHIMSVEAGGPDAVNNGIALSGTVHWMFDRGLLSLSDAGDILFSRAINDVAGVERMIHSDRKARLPKAAALRPHPRYLEWHRTERFHD